MSGQNNRSGVFKMNFNDDTSLSDLPVGKIVQPGVLTCLPETSIQKAKQLMEREKAGLIIIMDKDKPVGIWTHDDILSISPLSENLLKKPVCDFMCFPVKTARMNTLADDVFLMMRKDSVAHVLVLDSEEKPYGVVSQVDMVLAPVVEYFLQIEKGKTPLKPLLSFLPENISFDAAQDYMAELKKLFEKRKKTFSFNENRHNLIEKAIEFSYDSIMFIDANGCIESINPAFSRATGYEPAEITGLKVSVLKSKRHSDEFYKTLKDRLFFEKYWHGEIWSCRKNGDVFLQLVTVVAVENSRGEVSNYIAVMKEVVQNEVGEDLVFKLTHYNQLTALPNRRLLKTKLATACEEALSAGEVLFAVYINMVRFRRVTESIGYESGDEVIKTVAGRISSFLHEHDILGQVGPDEFIFIRREKAGTEEITDSLLNVLQAEIEKTIFIDDHELVMACNFGVSCYPKDGENPDDLLQNALLAEKKAASQIIPRYHYYSPFIDNISREKLNLENKLRKAIQSSEFLIYYQPIMDLSGKMVALEALLRWRHPKAGVVSPVLFIDIAEEVDLIIPIGDWVLCQVAESIPRFCAKYGDDFKISVNISIRQLRSAHFVDKVAEIIDFYKINPANLSFEITENMLLENGVFSEKVLQALSNLGVELVLDDFGTGYSSLSYLKKFPISKMKIDKSFVRDIIENKNDAELVKAIIHLAQTLGVKTVAEGVESEDQQKFLVENGIDYLQGFYFSHPVAIGEFLS